ncbi:Uncharacterised protein [Buttiauxella agrestis]|uniref:HTH Mu-type domain-containing protein n=1 Tax=Buttiauxella agrestis TaxID=82977 RepID=A0A381C7G1_9ENTR|nr:DNA-binding protein [Buttiauxella agrestis]SUW63854.1 Uncharacterised protein [Buttiauxella agrestis]
MKKNQPVVDIDQNKDSLISEWLAIKEMIGLPGMPGSAQGCHKMMVRMTRDNPEAKRKIPGTKAYEYHFSLLPRETLKVVFTQNHPGHAQECIGSNKLLNQWMDIFHSMSTKEQEQVVAYVFRHGFSSILNLVINNPQNDCRDEPCD